MIIQAINVNKSFIGEDIIKDASFIINEGDKVAVVGYNGAGKTTLARIICDEMSADSGEIIIAKNKSLGYLRQNPLVDSDKTLYEEVYSANEKIITLKDELAETLAEIDLCTDEDKISSLNTKLHGLQENFNEVEGYKYESLINGVIKGLGFGESHLNTSVSKLSGGEKTRLALAKELVKNPDILILDEPTNHLDISSLSWLEGFLRAYKGTLIIISHDRYFLDAVTNITIDIDNKKVKMYKMNFSKYIEEKEKDAAIALKAYENNQREIKRQEAVITKLKSFNREKSIKRAESREKLLAKMERVEKPQHIDVDMNLHLRPRCESGFQVLEVANISKSFGDLCLFKDISFNVQKGDKIALIGDNGSGKSTFFKILNSNIKADTGNFRYGSMVVKSYFDQEHQLLNENNNLIDEISDTDPKITETEIRNILASYLFRADDVFKRISTLSGGEKSRLTFVKLMLSEANLLFLDEPTNHLDLSSKAILEKGLSGYEGTLFIISHDRYFVNKVCNKILYLNNKTMHLFDGTYDEFMEKGFLDERKSEEKSLAKSSSSKEEWLAEKERQAAEKKRQNDIKKCEEEISKIEEMISDLDRELEKEEIYSDHVKATEIHNEKEGLEAKLNEIYEKWESLH